MYQHILYGGCIFIKEKRMLMQGVNAELKSHPGVKETRALPARVVEPIQQHLFGRLGTTIVFKMKSCVRQRWPN